jgi:hypothetical protein
VSMSEERDVLIDVAGDPAEPKIVEPSWSWACIWAEVT